MIAKLVKLNKIKSFIDNIKYKQKCYDFSF